MNFSEMLTKKLLAQKINPVLQLQNKRQDNVNMSQNFLEQLNSKNQTYLQQILNNKKINELRLPGNKYVTNTLLCALFELLQEQNLQSIHLSQIQFTKQSFTYLVNNLKHMTNLEEIEIFQSNINDQFLDQLCNMLAQSSFTKLKSIKLSDNQFGYAGAQSLGRCIKQLQKRQIYLEGLQLGGNKMKDGVIFLCQALSGLKGFKSLGLRDCQFTNASYQAISTLFSNPNSDLEDIQFKRNNLSKAQDLFKNLTLSTKIRVIECEDCNLNQQIIQVISSSLYNNSSLHAINFEQNNLQNCAQEISKLVLNCQCLTTLCLNNCQIDSQWINQFFQNLYDYFDFMNISLSGISLKGNKISDDAIQNIAQAVRLGKITSLDLSNNKITNQSLKILGEACMSPENKIRHLDLSGNRLNGQSVKGLCNIIQYSTKLLRIFITDCELSLENMEDVAEAIQKSNSIISCTCGGQSKYKNSINQQVKEKINKKLAINKEAYNQEQAKQKQQQQQQSNSQQSQKTTQSETSAENMIPLHQYPSVQATKSVDGNLYRNRRQFVIIEQNDGDQSQIYEPLETYSSRSQVFINRSLQKSQSLAQISEDLERISSVNSLRPFLGSSDNVYFPDKEYNTANDNNIIDNI